MCWLKTRHFYNNLLNIYDPKNFDPKKLKDCFILIDLDGTIIYSENKHFECYNKITGLSK